MSAYKSDFLNVLAERGFIHQVSEPEALDALAASSDDHRLYRFRLHGGFAARRIVVPIMLLHWLQQTGHRPIALMGGGTTRVGDPSGKDESRRLLTDDDHRRKTSRASASIFDKFLKFEGAGGNAIMANNADWLNALNYIDFLRDVGRHFSINRMLTFDSVKLRLDREQELSFLEFNYMILQAYDFVELHRRHGCVLQMGGSDQWGNIVSGIDLGRRLRNAQLFGLTSPLITTASGAKMGKTAAGAVWLNAELMSPYDYWQFWRNTEDADVVRFLKLFTVLPLDEIARLAALQGRGDQRGEEGARHRGDGADPRPRRGRRSRSDRADDFRGRRTRRQSADRRTAARRARRPASACSPPSSKRVSQARTAKSGAPLPTTRSWSTTFASPATRRRSAKPTSRRTAWSSSRSGESGTSCSSRSRTYTRIPRRNARIQNTTGGKAP